MKLAAIDAIYNPALPNSVNNSPSTGLAAYIAVIWTSMFLLAGIFVLFYLLYGGFVYITSMGDPKNSERARSIITNAIIGLAIFSVSYGIMVLLSAIFGISILSPVFPGIS
jgi:predicted secreted protein